MGAMAGSPCQRSSPPNAGLPTVAFGIALWFVLTPTPATARFLTRAEREWLQQRQVAAQGARESKGVGAPSRLAVVLGERAGCVCVHACALECGGGPSIALPAQPPNESTKYATQELQRLA